jgi:two-component system, sensor histidine kinase
MKVLIVEDNVLDAELAERELSREYKASLQFTRVDTKNAFITALDEFKPDLIISDYMMPTFDGMSALKIALERVPEVPFIVFTGSMNEDTAVACMKAGAWDYIIKEHLKRLGPAVRAAMEEKEVRRQREAARLEIEKAYRVKKDFLANISHELRTPLNGILGMCGIIEGFELGKQERYWLSMAKESAEKLNRIILDLLNFIDLESKKVTLDKRPFSVEELVVSAVHVFRKEAEKKGLTLRYDNTCGHSHFTGDKSRTAQIVWNLLANAVKFSEKGMVRVETKESDSSLCISVEDEGIGIEESKLPDIFLPLQQLENPYTKEHGGIGLGMSIVKNIVDLAEGTIRVDSAPGSGSRFEVEIPGVFSDEKPEGTQTPDEEVTAPFSQKTILVVEDEAINRLFVSTVLKKHGFTVVEARNGKEAVNAAVPSKPDLILMDIGLPVMDGLEAAKQILRNTATEDIPILALTAHAHPDEKERFLRGGMLEVITKPVSESELIDAIHRYI